MKTPKPGAHPETSRYSLLLTALAITAVILVNLLATALPLKLDLTRHGVFSLSPRSRQILSGLEGEAMIYALFPPGKEPATIAEVLKLYTDASSAVRISYIDIERNPGLAKKHDPSGKNLKPGSLLVVDEASSRHVIIPQDDLFSSGQDPKGQGMMVMGVAIEQRVTEALSWLSTGKAWTVAELRGHGETSIRDFGLHEPVARENTILKELALLSSGRVSTGTDLVTLISPKSDLGEAEVAALKEYMSQGGNLLVLLDVTMSRLPNLEGLLSLYGVAVEHGIVMEGAENLRAGNPFMLIPELDSHPLLASIVDKGYPVTMPAALGLARSVNTIPGLNITPLMHSSGNSWLRVDLSDNSPERKQGDKPGPWTLGFVVEIPRRSPGTSAGTQDTTVPGNAGAGESGQVRKSRLAVLGNALFIGPENPVKSPGNPEFFLNLISWTKNSPETLSLRPKSVFELPLRLDGRTTILLLILLVILIPGSLFITGLVVWLRRRRL